MRKWCKARPDYGTNLNLNRKVFDFIKSGGPSPTVVSTATSLRWSGYGDGASPSTS